MKTLSVERNRSLTLPKSVFKPTDKVAVITEGDTIILKKINLPKLSQLARRAKERPMSLPQIVQEVHKYRKEKKRQR